ncbi:Hypothetical protein conserved in the Yarrowia clade [Yarrowia lipolytica]|nr:Hypothetical protein conserved in the Yarrowia clade [Yarrowia lipolytica]
MSISASISTATPAQSSPYQLPLDDHMQEFEWLRVVESVLADREYSETEITQKELDELIPTLDSLEISTDEDDEISFGDYIHFSPTRIEHPEGTPRPQTHSEMRSRTPRSIPRTEWTRKPGSITPLEVHSPLELKRDTNGGTPRRNRPTKIPVLSSRLGPPIVPVGTEPTKPGLSAFRSNLQFSHLPKLKVFEDDSEEDAEAREDDSGKDSYGDDSSVQFLSEIVHNDSSVQIIEPVQRQPPSVSPPSTPPRTQSSQLGFAANVTQPLRRSRRLAEAELYNEPPSPGRICSPIKREINLKPSLRVSGNTPSSSKLISSLHSALTGSEPIGFYSANDLRARLEGKEIRDRFFDGRKRRTRRNQLGVKWAEELEW